MMILLVFLFCFQRGLWVRALSIASPDSISRIMSISERMGITDLYVQVVIAGSSYYKSDILPRSQYLSGHSPPDYDPLDSIIKYAKKKKIKVHAWINTFLVWSLDSLPESTGHIYYTHPDWILKDITGRSMLSYTPEERQEFGLEGTFIDPNNKEVRDFLNDICLEILNKYKVDGIHFDFIRYPGIFWGIDDTSRAGLVSGLNSRDMRWLTLSRYPKIELFNRWITYNIFLENRRRQKSIKDFLEQVKTSVKRAKKDCMISCAVFSNSSRASYQYAQDWWGWRGLIDYPVVMSYTTDTKLFKDFLNFALYYFPSAIMGIGFLWKGMELEANTEIEYVRQAKAKGICYFDFASIDTMADLSILLDSTMVLKDSVLQTMQNSDTNGIFIEKAKEEWIEKGREYIKYGEDLEFARFLLTLSLNPDQDFVRLGIDRKSFLESIYNDVAGFEYLNRILLSVSDKLFEPPHRVIQYEFLRWGIDSAIVRETAQKTKKLNVEMKVYPYSIYPLTKAVFEAKKGEKKIIETRSGIYIFKVKKINEGRGWVKRDKVQAGLLPIYIYWTIKNKFDEIYYGKQRKEG